MTRCETLTLASIAENSCGSFVAWLKSIEGTRACVKGGIGSF